MIVTTKPKRKPVEWAPITAVSSLILILAATLFPYDFSRPERFRLTNPLIHSRAIQARDNNLLIGTDGTFGQAFKGKIDEVRIYKRTLSQSEIERNMNTPVAGSPTPPSSEDLVAAYSLDEGRGSCVTDSSQNGNHGNLINGPAWTTGRMGGGLSFNGVNQYVEVPNSPSIDISGPNITLSLWVNIAGSDYDDGLDKVIIAKPWFSNSMADPIYQYAVEFDANGNKTLDFYFGDSSGTLRGPFACAIPLGQWTHVAFTYDGTDVRGYVNGDEKLSVPAAGPVEFSDVLANILLYMPLGFGLAGMAYQRRAKRATDLMKIVAVGFGLSVTIEILQIGLPSRTPSALDVASNTLGAALGSLGAFLSGERIFLCLGHLLQRNAFTLSTTKLAAILFGYAAFASLLSAKLQQATALGNWDKAFTLVLGNDHDGHRPWEGQITQLQITNKAVHKSEVKQSLKKGLSGSTDGCWVVSYDLKTSSPCKELTGRLPDLSWKGTMPHSYSVSDGVIITHTSWLETPVSVAGLVQEIQKTNQFTLSISCAPANTAQRGPARIFSLSRNRDELDFAMGQDGADLVLNLRTPITGVNGKEPPLVVPNVFTDTSLRNLLVTYDGSRLQAYVDGLLQPDSLKLSPGAALAKKLFPLKAQEMNGLGLVYYCLIFLPLGCILGIFSRNVRSGALFTAVLLVIIAFLASGALEFTLMGVRGGFFDAGNLLIGAFAATGSGLATASFVQRQFQL